MKAIVSANDLNILNICLNDGQICVACTESNQELFNLISTALVLALNIEGSDSCINCNAKLIQHQSAHKILLFKAMSNQPC